MLDIPDFSKIREAVVAYPEASATIFLAGLAAGWAASWVLARRELKVNRSIIEHLKAVDLSPVARETILSHALPQLRFGAMSKSAAVLLLIGTMVTVWAIRLPAVYPDFKSLYESAPSLGFPAQPASVSSFTYQAVHERALVIWIKQLSTHYVIPSDPSRGPLIQPESIWPGNEYFDDDFVRKKLGIPPDKKPPQGGVALAWEREPEKWSWIGGRLRACVFLGNFVFQEFSGGIIVGPLKPGENNSEGLNLAITKDGTRPQKLSAMEAIKCDPI